MLMITVTVKKKVGQLLRYGMAMMSFVLLSACMSTPREPVVANKNVDKTEIPSATGAGPSLREEIPKRWEEVYEGKIDGFQIEIAADVIVPDVRAIPVAVVKPKTITQAEADAFREYFLGEAALYERQPEYPYTKDEINERILYFKQILSDADSELNAYIRQLSEEEYNNAVDMINLTIEQLKKRLNNAPEQRQYVPVSDELKYNSMFRYAMIEGFTLSDPLAYLFICKNESNKFNECYYCIDFDEFVYDGKNELSVDTALKGVSIDLESARRLARECVSGIGADYLDIVYETTGYNCIPNTPEETWDLNYVFYFMRSLNGVAANFVELQPFLQNEAFGMETWSQETIEVHVDDRGVTSFNWKSPSELVETVTENAAVLDFETVMDTMKRQIYYKGVWGDTTDPYKQDIVNRKVVIHEIRLGLMHVAQQNNPEEYLLIPVWDFFGYEVLQYKQDSETQYVLDENHQREVREYRSSFLTLSALDGSVIDRTKGY